MLPQRRNVARDTRKTCSCSVRAMQVAWNLKVQRTFGRLGFLIGRYPLRFISPMLVMAVVLLFGLFMFKNETNVMYLYLPETSRIRIDATQMQEHFGNTFRQESIILTAPNVLTPDVLTFMAKLDDAVKSTVVDGIEWRDVCFAYSSFFTINTSDLYDQMFGEVQGLDKALTECIYDSPIKLWERSGSNEVVHTLSQNKILKDITDALNITLLKGRKTTKIKYEDISKLIASVEPLLAEVTRDKTGKIEGAKSTILFWMLKRTPEAKTWERAFTDTVRQLRKELSEDIVMYIYTERGFDDELEAILSLNKSSLVMGIAMICIFVATMVHKISLVITGALSIAMAVGASFGVSFMMGYIWGPLHPLLPFLLMGMGVDNLFILNEEVASLNAVKSLSIPEKIERTMKHTGPPVTVTAATNILAFSIGVSSEIPFLKSFCVFAAWSMVFLYIFQLFFFLPCIALSEWHQNWFFKCSLKSAIQKISKWRLKKNIFTSYLAPIMMNKYMKAMILLFTIAFLATNLYLMRKIKQNFNPMMYLDSESDPVKYYNALNDHFPHFIGRAGITIGPGIDYFNDKEMLLTLEDRLCNSSYVQPGSVTFWYSKYLNWLNEKYPQANPENIDELTGYLFEFLFLTTEGLQMIPTMRFSGFPLSDFNITSSIISFQNKRLNDTVEQANAMAALFEIIDEVAPQGEVWLHSEEYISWDTNQNVRNGMVRNLQLAVCGVGIISGLLFLNLRISIFVMSCVICTIVGLLGSLYWMDIHLEIASSLVVLICGSLSVDYATHVGIRYSQLHGSREERAIGANRDMGAAILYGGFSTFLAFVFLWRSKSYLFRTFCFLFTAVVVMGLFHGLVFLPVILSLLGPERDMYSMGNEIAQEETNRGIEDGERQQDERQQSAEPNGNVTEPSQ